MKKIHFWIVVLIITFNVLITIQFGYLVKKSKTASEIADTVGILNKIFKGDLDEFGQEIKRFPESD